MRRAIGVAGLPFNRFGVRVPAVVVSPLIEPGTVFRSPTGVPFDHTSVLATLRDWLAIPSSAMLPSLRITAAPTLESVLTRGLRRGPRRAAGRPAALAAVPAAPGGPTAPLNDLQASMLHAVARMRMQRELSPAERVQLATQVPTVGHLVQYFAAAGLTQA